MTDPIYEKDQPSWLELVASILLALITWEMMRVTPVFTEVFQSVYLELPSLTRGILRAYPLYFIIFCLSCIATILLIAERLRIEAGLTSRMRSMVNTLVGRILGVRLKCLAFAAIVLISLSIALLWALSLRPIRCF